MWNWYVHLQYETKINSLVIAPSCYSGEDTVNLVGGGQRRIRDLKVGDRIWSLNHRGTQLIEDEVFMMADNGPKKPSILVELFFFVVLHSRFCCSVILYISHRR